jgi:RNA recognition motif-containing protein
MNIYITNLSYNVNGADLKELFQEYGEVSSANVITDKITGKSRGFGFVEMPNREEAQKAMTELNNAEYDGKVITVNEARPKTERTERSGFNNERRSGGYNSRRY